MKKTLYILIILFFALLSYMFFYAIPKEFDIQIPHITSWRKSTVERFDTEKTEKEVEQKDSPSRELPNTTKHIEETGQYISTTTPPSSSDDTTTTPSDGSARSPQTSTDEPTPTSENPDSHVDEQLPSEKYHEIIKDDSDKETEEEVSPTDDKQTAKKTPIYGGGSSSSNQDNTNDDGSQNDSEDDSSDNSEDTENNNPDIHNLIATVTIIEG